METSKEKYVLSPERQRMERNELTFQAQLNERTLLPWNSILELEFLFERMLGQSCTFTESVTEVPEEYELPFEEIWHTESEFETGRIMVLRHELDYWDTPEFTGTEELPDEAADRFLCKSRLSTTVAD